MTPDDAPAVLRPDPSAQLEAAFRATAARMQGLGFVNAKLAIEAVDFAPWEAHWLGVMVTPWAMNLMVRPRDPAQWQPLRPGDKRRYEFPAGDYEFIGARDPAFGDYHVCSLFSPVLQFTDHDTARIAAKVARRALLDARTADYDETAAAAAVATTAAPAAPILPARPAMPPIARGGER